MNPELVATAQPADIARRRAAAYKRREAEANDAMDFLFLGNENGRHDARCVHDVPCSRDYDPHPPAPRVELAARTGIVPPEDERMYEGTGIAALYGLPGGEAHAWQLAGWNVGRGGV